ncbi:styrene-oxide isomerase StyC [Polycyclovorans algicola]|uniref:styrene-oxide isomerase StyC n=1 Tax=Polycyclovorans algicola TaxID=616992 RepID=UPI0004A707D3|nr:hypothetical protein [Polycyclovorans algicola]
MQTQQKKMIGHGAIVIFIGLAAGFGLVMSLIGGFELFPGYILEFEVIGDTRAWARAHAGGIMNGLFVISVALLTHAMSLSSKAATQLYWMLVGTGYANTLFYWGALFAPSRALTFGDNRLGETNIAGILGFGPALVFAVVAMIAMAIVVREAFSDR